jgi:multiple sugar transport system substrate-binding protein
MWFPAWVVSNYLVDVSAQVRNSFDLHWSDIVPVYRERIATYQSRVYAVPTDGDEYLMYYRRDLFERDGRAVPRTWQQYIEAARAYHGQDLNGDGVPDYGTCFVNDNSVYEYWQMWSILSPFYQTQGPSEGVFFDLQADGIKPLIDNPALRAALDIAFQINQYGSC